VKDAWTRLKKWASLNLPKTIEHLNRPAAAAQIQEFENAIGARLPNEVREHFRVHNGQNEGPGIVFGLPFLSLQDSLSNWKGWIDGYDSCIQDGSAAASDQLCSSFPSEFVRQAYFNKGWIPITYDSSGNHVGIDLDPGPKGTTGQVIIFGRDDEFHPVLARNWAQFLTDLADELERGNFRIDNADPNYPAFNLGDPYKTHFHSVGMHWSRGKLGLRRLSKTDQAKWKKWHGK
jgi:cell wall assembly regulator SMI1